MIAQPAFKDTQQDEDKKTYRVGVWILFDHAWGGQKKEFDVNRSERGSQQARAGPCVKRQRQHERQQRSEGCVDTDPWNGKFFKGNNQRDGNECDEISPGCWTFNQRQAPNLQ